MGGGAVGRCRGNCVLGGAGQSMTRTLFRTFLSVVLALALGVQGAAAQPCTFACNGPPSNPDHNRNTVWYALGGVAGLALGAFIASRLFPTPERGLPQEPPSGGDQPPVQPINLPPGGGGGAGTGP